MSISFYSFDDIVFNWLHIMRWILFVMFSENLCISLKVRVFVLKNIPLAIRLTLQFSAYMGSFLKSRWFELVTFHLVTAYTQQCCVNSLCSFFYERVNWTPRKLLHWSLDFEKFHLCCRTSVRGDVLASILATISQSLSQS